MSRIFEARAWAYGALHTSLVVLMIPSVFACTARQGVAQLGDFALQGGGVIKDAFVTYRTFGRLDEAKSNAVLVMPWYQGTSGQMAENVGPGKLVDSSKYFVIVVDVFGNGVASSPSNSTRQPGDSFPQFTIRDIVESQYQLVTRTFQLTHLHAVVGISMGGMQVFQWMTAHPDFMDKGISIVGTPQPQPDDRERLKRSMDSLRRSAWSRARVALSRWEPRNALNELRINVLDHVRQAEAVMSLDIPRQFGGSMEGVADVMRADLMVVSTWQDEEVNPAPAFALARAANAELLELDGRCGHQAPSCERATLWPAVGRFLSR